MWSARFRQELEQQAPAGRSGEREIGLQNLVDVKSPLIRRPRRQPFGVQLTKVLACSFEQLQPARRVPCTAAELLGDDMAEALATCCQQLKLSRDGAPEGKAEVVRSGTRAPALERELKGLSLGLTSARRERLSRWVPLLFAPEDQNSP